ncbi:MAG: site-specific integrase [Actinobacteria bacterium]|nr:site-specific integrase [Actinomycetota bacterium]
MVLRRALAQGVKWGWLVRNPAADASPPRVPATTIQPPAPADVARLFRTARDSDPQLATFVLLAAAIGARRSELVALRWSDFNLDQGTVVVSRGVVLGARGLVEKDTKTHSARRIALNPGTVEALQAHLQRMIDTADACGATLAPNAFVFTFEPDGSQPARPESMSRSFRRLCEQAGITGVRLHDLRHYVATRLLAAGVDVRTVAGRLGHRNASTTLNVYSHFLAETDREAANVLGRLFDEANGAEP